MVGTHTPRLPTAIPHLAVQGRPPHPTYQADPHHLLEDDAQRLPPNMDKTSTHRQAVKREKGSGIGAAPFFLTLRYTGGAIRAE